MTEIEWVLLKSFAGGHSYWRVRDEDRVSICDQSGNQPDRTDDGCLWLDAELPLVFQAGQSGVLLDVRRGSGAHSFVMVTFAEAMWLMNEFTMKFKIIDEEKGEWLIPVAISRGEA